MFNRSNTVLVTIVVRDSDDDIKTTLNITVTDCRFTDMALKIAANYLANERDTLVNGTDTLTVSTKFIDDVDGKVENVTLSQD